MYDRKKSSIELLGFTVKVLTHCFPLRRWKEKSMPSVKAAPSTQRKKATKHPLYKGADDTFFRKLIEVTQLAQQSTAHHSEAKKLVVTRAKEDIEDVSVAMQHLVLGVLKQVTVLAADALRRYATFLRDVCKGVKEALGNDFLAVDLLRTLLPYGEAANKVMRLHVVTVFDELIRTLEAKYESDERTEFYDSATQMLKRRMYDICPHIRERAVAAITSFQAGDKSDDVTCHLVAVLTDDPSPEVRRQILRGIQVGAGRREFLHTYFAAMMRSTRDAKAKVREAAWEALCRFKWTHLNHYCHREKIDSLDMVAQGLNDPSISVRAACRITLTKSWLVRDMKENCAALLDAIRVNDDVFREVHINLVSAQRVASELLLYMRTSCAGNTLDHTQFRLRCQAHEAAPAVDVAPTGGTAGVAPVAAAAAASSKGLTFGNVLMWKALCETLVYKDTLGGISGGGMAEDDANDAVAEDTVLIPMQVFQEVVSDVTMIFAKPGQYTPKLVSFPHPDTVEEVLNLLLGMLEVYADGGFLAHTDNTTRGALLGRLGFLLKVVPDTDPSLFVDTAVKSIRLLTQRQSEEATSTISDVLGLLFTGVQIRKEHGLTFEDVETLGRLDTERHAKLADLRRRYGAQDEEVVTLQDQIAFDQKFLLRMQHIVFAYLSNARRMERVPPFCFFVIQLGRQQSDREVQCVATRSLGLLCLIHAESVHTFFPVLMQDAFKGDAMYTQHVKPESDVSCMALAAVFDICCEYGLKFFDSSAAPPPGLAGSRLLHSSSDGAAEDATEESLAAKLEQRGDGHAADEAARQVAEATAAYDAVHQRGGGRVLLQLAQLVTSRHMPQRQIAILGFCKLLSCNRVPQDRVTLVLANIMVHASMQPTPKKGSSVLGTHTFTAVRTFLRSFSASSGTRQAFLAEASVLALRVVVQKFPDALALASRLLNQALWLTDAANLKSVKDADPQFSKAAAAEYQGQDGGLGDRDGADVSDDPTSTVGGSSDAVAHGLRSVTGGTSHYMNASALSKSVGHLRLRHELSRLSLHEYLAMELLTDLAASPTSDVLFRLVISTLPKMRFYCTGAVCAQRLVEHCEAALASLPSTVTAERKGQLQEILAVLKNAHTEALHSAKRVAADMTTSALSNPDDEMPRRCAAVETRLEARAASLHNTTGGPLDSSLLSSVAHLVDDACVLGFSREAQTAQSQLAQVAAASRTASAASQATRTARATPAAVPAAKKQSREREGEIELEDILGRGQKKARKK